MENITSILKKYLSKRIPQKVTNILFQMFNGINAAILHLEYRIEIYKRERNILTAQNIVSLRSHAAKNGFEPKLRVPSCGVLKLKIDSKLFSRVGYPIFIQKNAVFIDKLSKIKYYYNSDRSLRIDKNTIEISVIEGELKSQIYTATNEHINKFTISDENVAENSIVVTIDGVNYLQVESFFDNENLNDDKQFLFKFSNDIQTPIIVYVKNCYENAQVTITYRISLGEQGNIDSVHQFETSDFLNYDGEYFDVDDAEVEITNIQGFEFGSNGTDENSLRAAIGYNHSQNLLYDKISYSNFILKFSNVLLQNITHTEISRHINNIYLSKKQSVITKYENAENLIQQYKAIVSNQSYIFSENEKANLSKFITEYEYALTSHTLNDSKVCKFALQIMFETIDELNKHKDLLSYQIYLNFSKFLHNRYFVLNLEVLFDTFMNEQNTKFSYTLFNENDEANKIKNNSDEIITSYIVKHDEYLPILFGDFNIIDSSNNIVKLFFDINIVS